MAREMRGRIQPEKRRSTRRLGVNDNAGIRAIVSAVGSDRRDASARRYERHRREPDLLVPPARSRPRSEAAVAGYEPPVEGTWRYTKTEGNDMVTVPAGLHCHWEMDWTSTSVVVDHTPSGTVLDWQINANHTEREVWRFGRDGASLIRRHSAETCAAWAWEADASYSPAIFRFRAPLAKGASWKGTAKAAGWTERYVARVLKRERVTVDAGTFDAWVVEHTTTYAGDMTGERTDRFWFVPSLGLPVKQVVDQLTKHASYTFQANYTIALAEVPPSAG